MDGSLLLLCRHKSVNTIIFSFGKSHSFETPTSCSPRPRAKTISVAEGKNEMSRGSVIGKTLKKIFGAEIYNIYINSCFIWEFWYELVSFGLDEGPRSNERQTTDLC